MASPATKLLKDIEPLSAPQRRQAVAAAARRLAGTPELAAVLAELAERGRYERIMSIQLAAIAGQRNHLVGQLDVEGQEFVARAVAALVRVGVEAEDLLDRFPLLAQRTRRTLYRALGHGRRVELADALLTPARHRFGDVEAVRILPHCSASVVAKYLPELAYAVPNWHALSRRHIETVLDYVEGLAADAGEADWPELWGRIAAAAEAAADRYPDRLLALAGLAVRYGRIDGLHAAAGRLARYDATAVLNLILHPSGRGAGLGGRTLWSALRDLPEERLVALCSVYPEQLRRQFLHVLAPSRRAAVVRRVFIRPGVDPGAVDLTVLDELPRHERAGFARDLLARPGGSEVRAVRERLTARLPWDEAEPVLRAAIRRPTAEERTPAYLLLVVAATGTRDPAAVGVLLESLRRLRNEQDPVRRIALQAVADIPPSLLRAEHLTMLESLGGDALSARDRSYGTTAAVSTLARTLLRRAAQVDDPAFAESAARLLENLVAHSGTVDLWQLHHNLPKSYEHRLFDALRHRLDNDAARDQWTLALELASGLGKRAWHIAELQQLILRACGARADAIVQRAVGLALDNPATRDAHLATLLNRDRSLIALPRVQQLIATRRTDLLDSLLGAATPGRFISPKVRLVPNFSGGFAGWTPRQVELYGRLLAAHVRSKEPATWEKAAAVRQLGTLPGSFERLVGYAEHPEPMVAEAALTGLGRCADAEAASTVLGRFVDSDRARVAVSGIASRAGHIAPDRVAAALTPLLDSPKITSLKEGVRLLAALHAPEAMASIRAIWERPNQHRDVRRAAVFACRWLLEHDGAWQILTEATHDPEVASEALNIAPALLPISQRRRLARLVRELAGGADIHLAAEALRVLGSWQRWAPPDTGDMLMRRLADLGEVGLWRQMVQALVSGGYRSGIPNAVDRLIEANQIVLEGRDLPARQRLTTLIDSLCTAAEQSDEACAVARTLAERLSREPTGRLAIPLLLAQIRWNDTASSARAIRGACGLARGALVTYPSQRLRTQLPHALRSIGPHPMATIARDLVADTDTALTAVEFIAQCGHHFGWSPTWVELLAILRTHEQADIRAAAHAVFTVAE